MALMASVAPSEAPQLHDGIRSGYLAVCNSPWCDGAECAHWCGDWHPHWIDAKLDALVHNLEQHRTVLLSFEPTWDELVSAR